MENLIYLLFREDKMMEYPQLEGMKDHTNIPPLAECPKPPGALGSLGTAKIPKIQPKALQPFPLSLPVLVPGLFGQPHMHRATPRAPMAFPALTLAGISCKF